MFEFLQRFRRRIQDLPTFLNRYASTEAERQHDNERILDDAMWHWPKEEFFCVEAVLARYPELRSWQPGLVALAVEEFNRRRNAGENLSPTQFAGEYPGFRSALLDSLLFEDVLEVNSWFEQALQPVQQNREIQWPAAGEVIAGFHLVEPLGSGAFSRVFVAEDLEFNRRRVALKICRNDTHEANTLADLQHQAIGAVHYVREVPERGLIAICMPFSSRTTLANVIHQAWHAGRIPQTAWPVWEQVRRGNRLERDDVPWSKTSYVDWAIDLTITLARALAASHARDIVHCDLKPNNILVSSEGTPILVDFNVAFRTRATTSPGNVGGTLPYMAPEQIRAFAGQGFADISGTTDVFGLGATIYELLTGQMPFGGVTTADDGVLPLLQVRRQGVVPIRRQNRLVDADFAAVIESCLSYDIDARPQSAEELADRLEAIREQRRTRSTLPVTTLKAAIATAAVAAVAVFFSTKDASVAPPIGAAPLAGTNTQPAAILEIPEPVSIEEQATLLVKEGYARFDAGEFEVASKLFGEASRLDTEHEGAILGQVRCFLHLGKTAAAARLAQNWTTTQTVERTALTGYFAVLDGNCDLAVDAFRRAANGGLDTAAIRTNLGYALYLQTPPQGQRKAYDEAKAVLEDVVREFGNDTGASLALAQIYPMVQQNLEIDARKALMAEKKPPIVNPSDFYDPQIAQDLIESAPAGPARAFTASLVYPMLAQKLSRTDPESSKRLLGLALKEFDNGVALGHDIGHWNSIRMMAQQIQPECLNDSEIARKYADVPADRLPPVPRPLFLCDPFNGSRLDGWTGRLLRDVQDSRAGLIAASE